MLPEKMKKLKFIFCLLCLIIISHSCILISFHSDDNFYPHILYLSFQDTLGNDLVRELAPEFNDDSYSLAIYFDGVRQIHHNEETVHLISSDTLGYYQLNLSTGSSKDDRNPNRMITYKLSYPDLFGNFRDFTINTWWINYKICNRIEINGKEIPFKEILYYDDKIYSARITLNI